jgi:hypothetical protein
MKITVTAINTDEAVLVRGTSALGWLGKFGCPLVTGDAVFIPARGHEDNLRAGSQLTVETSFDEVRELQVQRGDVPDSMHPLTNPCDYSITGTVTSVAPQGVVRVSVRGLIFTLERKELNGTNPQVGDHLSFELHRLTLWDTAS